MKLYNIRQCFSTGVEPGWVSRPRVGQQNYRFSNKKFIDGLTNVCKDFIAWDFLLQCFSTGVPRVAAGGSPKQTEIAWDEIREHSSMQL